MHPASNQAAFSVFVLVQQLPLITSGISAPEPIDSNRYDEQLKSGKRREMIMKSAKSSNFAGSFFFANKKTWNQSPRNDDGFHDWLQWVTMNHLSAIDPCQCSSFHNRSASSHSHPLPGDGSKKVTPKQFPSFQCRPWWNLWRLFYIILILS